MKLLDKVTIITGGASGIGKATSELFCENGAKVIICNRNRKTGLKLQDELRQKGYDATFIETDVSNEESVKDMVSKVLKTHDRIDVLFNNAGIGRLNEKYKIGSLLDTPLEDWNAAISINLGSVYLVSKHVLPIMIKQNSGSIINNASIAALIGYPGSDSYVAAKGGIVSLTKAMTIDYGKYNIRVNCICPGLIESPMTEKKLKEPEIIEKYKSFPLERMGSSDEVANLVLFLASDDASYVTGSIIPVDGGWSVM